MNTPICAHDVPRTQSCAPCAGAPCYCEICDRDCQPRALTRWPDRSPASSWICLACIEEHERELREAA